MNTKHQIKDVETLIINNCYNKNHLKTYQRIITKPQCGSGRPRHVRIAGRASEDLRLSSVPANS